MENKSGWRLDYLQILAVVLVVIIGWGLSALSFISVEAEQVTAGSKAVVQAELGDMQPTQIVQREDQWVARF